MKNQFNLNIKTPCLEDFNNFSTTQDGGFCDSCEKEVIDFTTMDTNQIKDYFNTQSSKNTCGRFNNSQLKTYQTMPEKRKYLSVLSGIGLACFSLLSLTTAQAQETNSSTRDASQIKAQTEKNITVKGTILDEAGIPLPSATILLEGTNIGTTTDFDGNYEFPQKLKKGDVLVINYVGYVSKKVTIENENSDSLVEIKLSMDEHNIILMGKVAVKEVYKSKRKK